MDNVEGKMMLYEKVWELLIHTIIYINDDHYNNNDKDETQQ